MLINLQDLQLQDTLGGVPATLDNYGPFESETTRHIIDLAHILLTTYPCKEISFEPVSDLLRNIERSKSSTSSCAVFTFLFADMLVGLGYEMQIQTQINKRTFHTDLVVKIEGQLLLVHFNSRYHLTVKNAEDRIVFGPDNSLMFCEVKLLNEILDMGDRVFLPINSQETLIDAFRIDEALRISRRYLIDYSNNPKVGINWHDVNSLHTLLSQKIDMSLIKLFYRELYQFLNLSTINVRFNSER